MISKITELTKQQGTEPLIKKTPGATVNTPNHYCMYPVI